MGYIVRMPKLGLEMEEGTLLDWMVEEGGEVTEGEQIAEVESEKSVGEVEAREDGVLRRMYLQVDETVPPSTPMGIVAAPDADISDLEAEAEADLEADETEQAAEGAEPATASSDTAGADASAGGGTAGGSADVKASPRAEKRAEALGVDLTTVEGTGPQGAVTADDVEAAAEADREAADTDTPVERDTEIRRIVLDDAAAHRYERATAVADEAAATALFETTEAVRSAFEESVTMTDVLAVVASAALADHPTVNATYSEGTHHLQKSQNLALAVDVEGDPTAGVIPAAGELSVAELVAARRDLAGGDRESVPTFTLANAGETDSEGLLVNEPAVAALAVDPTGQRSVPVEDGVDLRPLVTASLTYDTRALDAADAREFLATFFDRAEDAPALVLGTYRGGE
jgi:pyruvate dehydrogenase E2 component (dihydrolipoamide acetyltransferase)